MGLKEQDVVLTTTDKSGNKVIQLPITRKENVEGLDDALGKKQEAGNYAAEDHDHEIADVNGLQGALDGKQAKGNYASATHGHAISDVSGLQKALEEKQAAGNYAAETHGHAISEVSGLQNALDGKQAAGSYAAADHDHAIADVSGLQSALDGKQAKGDYATKTELETVKTTADSAVKKINGATPDENGNVDIEIPEVDTSTLVVKTGDRGDLAGYENAKKFTLLDTSGGALVINQDSPDSFWSVSCSSVSIENGSSGTAWTKIYLLSGLLFQDVTLGSKWGWAGGETPSFDGGGMLVMAWNGASGVVIYIYDGLATAEQG